MAPDVVRERFRGERIEATAQSAPSAYLLGSIAERLGDASLQRAAAAARTFAEHVELLRADVATLLPFLRRNRRARRRHGPVFMLRHLVSFW